MNKATVIIPTIGGQNLDKAISSVLNQSIDTDVYLVCDGSKYIDYVANILLNNRFHENKNFRYCIIPENVGAGGFYGHRIYSAFSHLINTEYALFLDEDNWFDVDHVETCITTIEKNNLLWCYSLRKIVDKQGNYICDDNCESLGKWSPLGYNLVDTNSYCFKTKSLIHICQTFHGGWGQDRIFYDVASKHMNPFGTTGKHTVNYRLEGNEGSVKKEFFIHNNELVKQHFKGELPWLAK